MQRTVFCVVCLLFMCVWAGCGTAGESAETQTVSQPTRREARRSAQLRHLRQAHRVAVRERLREEEALAAEEEVAREAESSECDPNYSGACLNPSSSDYDCEGGSGNGPDYTGPVTVVGEDHYGLDSDSDGYGCE